MTASQPALPAPTWTLWRQLMAESTRSRAGKQAGLWAFGVLERTLGHDWPERAWRKDGEVPGLIRLSAIHAVAFCELLELALRLHLLHDVPGAGKLRKELRTDPRAERLVHTRLQLEVGALGAHLGWTVAFEGSGGGPFSDVTITGTPVVLAVETFAVFTDKTTREGQRFWDDLSGKMMRIRFAHNVAFDGRLLRRLTPQETSDLVDQLETTARDVAEYGDRRYLKHSGAEICIVPSAEADGTRFSGPPETARGWERVAIDLRQKAEQARQSGARWLRVNLHDGMWQFNEWAAWPLAIKSDALARWSRDALSGAVGIDGVVFSSGAVLGQGAFVGESCRTDDGVFGLRRVWHPLRVRETVVVPASGIGSAQASEWVRVYDAEPAWLGWAVEHVGLGDIDDILAWQAIENVGEAPTVRG